MIKRETFELLKQITVYYDKFVMNPEKVNLWHDRLKDYPFEAVQGKLNAYVKEFDYPPKVSDLIPKQPQAMTIPNSDETKKMINERVLPASEEVVRRELANMRAILGIVRG